jgi:hypothetical protein
MNTIERLNGGKWAPGASGNPAGRPVGARNRFAEAFVGDVATVWAKHGTTILENMATAEPTRFAELCGRIVPRDVQLSVSQRIPGGLDADEWTGLLEILQAIKMALPGDARKPGEIVELVTDALRLHSAKLIESDAPNEQTGGDAAKV